MIEIKFHTVSLAEIARSPRLVLIVLIFLIIFLWTLLETLALGMISFITGTVD